MPTDVKDWKISTNTYKCIFVKCCRKNIQLKLAYPQSFHFSSAFLHINFSSHKGSSLSSWKMRMKRVGWGQVMAAGKKKKLKAAYTLVMMSTGTSILWCSWATSVIVSKEWIEKKAFLHTVKGTGKGLWPWLQQGSLYEAGFYCVSCNCALIGAEGEKNWWLTVLPRASEMGWVKGSWVSEGRHPCGMLMPGSCLPKMRNRLL